MSAIELLDELEAGELSVEFEGAGAAGGARVGARALLAADRALDRVPDRRRRAARHGVRARPGDPGLQRRHRPPARGDVRADRAAARPLPGPRTSSCSRRTRARCRRWSASTARTSSTGRSRSGCSAATCARCSRSTRHLATLDAWITGLRRDQWATRTDIRKIEIDHDHGAIVKLNPLAEWTEDEVWDYVRERDVPYHPLYDHGYTSIGCAPCTRAIAPGRAGRAGRWWWEENAPKECGIHCAVETGGLEHELRALIGEDDDVSAVRLAGRGAEVALAEAQAVLAIAAGRRLPRTARRARRRDRRRRGRRATTPRRSSSCSSSACRAGGSARSTGRAASRPRSGSTGGCRAAPRLAETADDGDRGAARARRARARVGPARARSGPARSRSPSRPAAPSSSVRLDRQGARLSSVGV